jgi:hypothetical protein
MPPMLPSKKGMCPAVLRIDGGHLRELGTNFLTILGRYAVPEGSVIMIGSLSHLMEEGRVGYAKALVTEQIRFSKAFINTVHVVPFVPPPLCGTNDPGAAALIIGGSNANRLTEAFTDLGKKVETISGGGWKVTTESVDILLPILRAKLDLLDPAAPVILWCMDSNFFRQLTTSGDLAGITRGEDGRFHITGKLMVTPYSLLRDMLAEINRIVDACGTHPVMILEAVPRFLIRSCCMDLQHCTDIRGADPASVDACKKIMEDLASLNGRVGDHLQSEQVKMVRTGDLLTGRVDSPIALYMDTLYDLWGSDTVHA